jgi:hypothetical protein
MRILAMGVAAALAMALLPQMPSATGAAEKVKAGAKANQYGAHVAISLGDGRTIESKKSRTKTAKPRGKSSKCADGFDCSGLVQWSVSPPRGKTSATKGAKSR